MVLAKKRSLALPGFFSRRETPRVARLQTGRNRASVMASGVYLLGKRPGKFTARVHLADGTAAAGRFTKKGKNVENLRQSIISVIHGFEEGFYPNQRNAIKYKSAKIP
jgi:predicted peptidase